MKILTNLVTGPQGFLIAQVPTGTLPKPGQHHGARELIAAIRERLPKRVREMPIVMIEGDLTGRPFDPVSYGPEDLCLIVHGMLREGKLGTRFWSPMEFPFDRRPI